MWLYLSQVVTHSECCPICLHKSVCTFVFALVSIIHDQRYLKKELQCWWMVLKNGNDVTLLCGSKMQPWGFLSFSVLKWKVFICFTFRYYITGKVLLPVCQDFVLLFVFYFTALCTCREKHILKVFCLVIRKDHHQRLLKPTYESTNKITSISM